MQEPSQPSSGHPAKSAFAAAFFSFLVPGLGQAYVGRYMRALAWITLPVLAGALLAGTLLNRASRQALVDQLLDPAILLLVLVVIIFDLVYRLLSLLDAYRLARALPGAEATSPASRVGSLGGLLAVLLVLVISHVAVARPVYLTYDFISSVFSEGGEDDPGASFSLDPSLLPRSLAPGASAGASPTADVPTPSPAPTAQPWTGKGRLSVLLIGVDAGRKNEPTHNTDTMMVITADPGSGKLGVISLPRDTQNVPLPASWPAARAYGSVYPNKINTLANAAKARPDLFPGAGKNGYGALAGVLGNLYGLDIPYYVSVDLSGFRDAINALGGVVVDVQAPVNDPYYPADDGRGYLKLYIPPGIQYMDGAKSLAYARSRHGAGNDFVRASRQERVVTSVREQFDIGTLLQPGVIDELMRILKGSIKTNIPPGLLPQLASLAQHVDLNRRVSVVLQPPSYGQVCYPCPPYGLWAITPNVAAIRRAVKEIFTTTPAQRRQREALEGEAAIVSVLNGTPGDNTRSTRIADQLASLGVNATVPPVEGGRADRSDHTDTVIIAYNGAEQSKPETIALLQKSLGGTLQTAADPEQAADIVVIVGTGTQVPKPSG